MVSKLVNSLDWDVKETPVMCGGKVQNGGNIHKGYKGLQRTDTKEVLAIVKKSYTPTTNETLKNLVSEIEKHGNYKLNSFLEIGGGKKVLCWLENTKKINLLGWESKDYLVIGNSFDYSSSLFVGNTNILLRCENQFTKLHGDSNFRVLHSKGSTQKILNFQNDFQQVQEQSNLFYTIVESFGEVEVDKLIVEQFVKHICKNQFEQDKKINKVLETKKVDLETSINKEMNEVGKNLFGLFNGATYYSTHKRDKEKGVFGNVLGGSRKINDLAWDFCLGVLEQKMNEFELQQSNK